MQRGEYNWIWVIEEVLKQELEKLEVRIRGKYRKGGGLGWRRRRIRWLQVVMRWLHEARWDTI